MKALFDTPILRDYLYGKEDARREIARYETPMISAITVTELLLDAKGDEAALVDGFLRSFRIVPVGEEVARAAAALELRHGVDTASALHWAAARSEDAIFVTRNKTAFPAYDPGVRLMG
jgi:predicted nucleic acid-binding protein